MLNRTDDGVYSYETITRLQLDADWPALEVGLWRDGGEARVVIAQEAGPHYLPTPEVARRLADELLKAADRADGHR